MKCILATLAVLGIASPALATTITIELPGDAAPDTQTVAYSCGDRKISATYINTTGNSLAVVTIGAETVVMANVLSGSGARYSGGKYVWWTKRNEADFYDLTNGENAPGVHCTEVK